MDTPIKPIGRAVRERLVENAMTALADARRAAAAVVEELAKDGGGEDEIIDGHLLELRWALGERRGLGNALYDLVEEGLVPEASEEG